MLTITEIGEIEHDLIDDHSKCFSKIKKVKVVPVKQHIGINQGKKGRKITLKNRMKSFSNNVRYFWKSSETVKTRSIEVKKNKEIKKFKSQAQDQCLIRIIGKENTFIGRRSKLNACPKFTLLSIFNNAAIQNKTR